MRVLVTGISGLDRGRVWPKSDRFRLFDLGEEMLRVAREHEMALTEDNILHAGRDTLSALRAAAIARLVPSLPADGDPDHIVVVSTHSLFARTEGLEEGLQAKNLAELRPEVWITLIDGPQAIEERLKAHKAEYLQLSVLDVVRWQEFEVFYSRHLAGDFGVQHYAVVPVTQPEVFRAVAERDPRPLAYASYPMTHAKPEDKEKIDQFVERLKEHYIVFDPKSIESSHGTQNHHSQRDLEAISSHTIVRDLDWFIRINADTVIAYWPAVIYSSGMSDELKYAFEIGKQTILVTERDERGGVPFLSPFST